MPPPPPPIDISHSAMRERVDALREIKHHPNARISEWIVEELDNTGERGWTYMAKQTEEHGVLWTRKVSQALINLEHQTWRFAAVKTIVKRFRAILCKHITTIVYDPFRLQFRTLSESTSPEVKCLKLSLLDLSLVNVEALWEGHDEDGITMNYIHSYILQIVALSQSVETMQNKRDRHRAEIAGLHEQIRERVESISNEVWEILSDIWLDFKQYWNDNVECHGLPATLHLDPRNEPNKMPTAHSLGRSHRAFVPINRRFSFF